MKRILATLICAAIAPAALAQPFSMAWFTIDGGAQQTAGGGTFVLDASIGQPDAMNTVMTGGTFSLQGGFWSAFTEGDAGCPADIDGDGDADAGDFFAYLDLFAAGDPGADLDGDGDIDADDFFMYLDFFSQGC